MHAGDIGWPPCGFLQESGEPEEGRRRGGRQQPLGHPYQTGQEEEEEEVKVLRHPVATATT